MSNQQPPSYQKQQESRAFFPPDENDTTKNTSWDNNNNNNSYYYDTDTGDSESEVERQNACRGMTLIAFLLFAILIFFRYFTASWWFGHHTNTNTPNTGTSARTTTTTTTTTTASHYTSKCPENIPFCSIEHQDREHQVERGQRGFPSFLDYGIRGPLNVSYDGRSFLVDGDRVLFLSGSVHPIRETQQTWDQVLDKAVDNGLNMVTIYVFWAEHQQFPDQDMDWTLPAGRGGTCHSKTTQQQPSSCGWSLADAIRAAASRGLFVHARIGPYVCAEYNYGGIPEWVPLHEPSMRMRRLNKKWLNAMEKYVKSTIDYFSDNKLFAFQGGPVVAAQIENELGEEEDDNGIPIMNDDMPPINEIDDDEDNDDSARVLHSTKSVRKEATVQEYADWCGSLVAKLSPHVIWTMCNGLSANNTISTCNGDCSTNWLENNGSSGKIQLTQPAMWTEDEGGFQMWGDDSSEPSDYFWGRTARAMAYDALRWFARGGTHLNYYMFSGGYNRGRMSAAGILNAYATDAPVCSSGQARQPKFDHFLALHWAIKSVAPVLLDAPTALHHGIKIKHRNDDGQWKVSGKQLMFVYRSINATRTGTKEVVFVENNDKKSVVVELNLQSTKEETIIIGMDPFSAMLIADGSIVYDTFTIARAAMSYKRKIAPVEMKLLGWSSCAEVIGVVPARQFTKSSLPVEQTSLNVDAKIFNDYAWFEKTFRLKKSASEAVISIETQKASAMVLFLDGVFQGEVSNHEHAEGNTTFTFDIGALESGDHVLAILSESLGYFNLIGRWGAKTTAKVKGITGDVLLSSLGRNQSLTGGGKPWKSSPGLNGGKKGFCREITSGSHPKWTSAAFDTPLYNPITQAMYLNITSGRGHIWLNGHDLGRFWNITRGDTDRYSQQYYFIPQDFLMYNGDVNNLVFFDALGSDLSKTNLLVSWLEESDHPTLKDEVDFPMACI